MNWASPEVLNALCCQQWSTKLVKQEGGNRKKQMVGTGKGKETDYGKETKSNSCKTFDRLTCILKKVNHRFQI